MLPAEYASLKADIESRGLIVPIETINGQLLDGRHRFRACKDLGIEPDAVEVDLGDMSPAEYVWSVNGIRRHLTPGQRAAVAVELLPELKKAAKERQREAGKQYGREQKHCASERSAIPPMEKRYDAAYRLLLTCDKQHGEHEQYIYFAQGVHGGLIKIGRSQEPPERLKQLQNGAEQPLQILRIEPCPKGREKELHKKFAKYREHGEWFRPVKAICSLCGGRHAAVRATDQAAAMVGVGTRTVEAAQKLKAESPQAFQEVKDGKITITEANKQVRKARQAAKEKALASAAGKSAEWTVTKAQDIVQCATIITDPPYGILDEEWEPTDLEATTRDWLTRWNECGAELILSFFSQRFMWDAKTWFDDCLTNYTFQQLLVWHYPNNKSPQSRKGFKQTWEPIFFYRRTDSERQIVVGGTEWGGGLNDFDCHVAAVPQSNFNDADCKVHPAQKPVSVMRWLINAATQRGDLIADPFCGSGTTGIAALQLGRRFHGIETDGAMVKTAKQRIKAYGQLQQP